MACQYLLWSLYQLFQFSLISGTNRSCYCIDDAILIDTCLEVMLSLDTPREILLSSTGLLMAGIVALANAGIRAQMASAAAYASLIAAYWMVAALSNKKHWNLSCFSNGSQRTKYCKLSRPVVSSNSNLTHVTPDISDVISP